MQLLLHETLRHVFSYLVLVVHCRIIEVKAYSHQGYPITYELTSESGSQSNEFAIDSTTGVVDLLRRLDYEKDPQQYHLRVRAIENGRPPRYSSVHVSTIRDFSYVRVPTAQGKQGKWPQKNPCHGKHREFGNLAKTQGIWFAQVVNSLILKIKYISNFF